MPEATRMVEPPPSSGGLHPPPSPARGEGAWRRSRDDSSAAAARAAASALEELRVITAALAALPLIAELGQSVGKTLKHDLAGLFGANHSGQNVPGAATSATASPPTSFPALAQSFRGDLSALLVTLQGAAGSLQGA